MNIVIREMSENDWKRVAEIYYQGIQTNMATFQQEVPCYEEWDKSYLKKLRYVCTIDDNVVGWAALFLVSGRCVYAGVAELSIYIDEQYRGQGIGTKLLTYVVDAAETSGIWTIQASIMEENHASINLHKKCGFRMVGYIEKIGKDRDGVWRNTVLMERRSKLKKYN